MAAFGAVRRAAVLFDVAAVFGAEAFGLADFVAVAGVARVFCFTLLAEVSGSGGSGTSDSIDCTASGAGVGTSSLDSGLGSATGVGLGASPPCSSSVPKIDVLPACCSYGPRLYTRGCVNP